MIIIRVAMRHTLVSESKWEEASKEKKNFAQRKWGVRAVWKWWGRKEFVFVCVCVL